VALSLGLGTSVSVAATGPGDDSAPELRFGSVAMDIPAEMYRRLTPLKNYLSTALGRPVSLRLSPNMPEAINAVSTGDVDLAYLTPVAYLEAERRSKAKLVVKTVTQGKSSFRLMIVVRDDSPIKSIADLRGKSFAFGDKAAILQRAVVVGAGMPLEALGQYQFIGHYDNIAQGVARGDFDAGILKDTTAYAWQKKGLRIIHQSKDLPPYNIVASAAMSDALVAQVRAAFLRLDPKIPAHRSVIEALDREYDGFAPTRDRDYDEVRRLIAPFAKK
jgi:phosphonate transport system substrate-binding protein